MSVTVREVVRAADDVTQQQVVTSSAVAIGDLLLLVHMTDGDGASDMLAPTGTDDEDWQGPVIIGRDNETSTTHIKAWWREVTTGGAQTVNTNQSADWSNHNHTFVLIGVDLTDPIVAVGEGSSFSDSQVAPGISGLDEGLLVCGWISDDNGLAYAAPGSMTGGTTDSGFSDSLTAWEALAADGATGDRTATANAEKTYTAVSVTIRPAGGDEGVTGEGAATAPTAVAAGAGTAQVAGTGAASGAAATSAAAGTVAVSGTAAATAAAAEAAGVGSLAVSGSAASAAPAAVAAGVGEVIVSGSGAAVAPAGAAAGAGFVGDTAPPPVDLNVTIGAMRDGGLAAVGTMRDAAATSVAGMAPPTSVGAMRTTFTVGSMRE